MPSTFSEQVLRIERANSLTHGAGLLFGLFFVPLLIAKSTAGQHWPAIVGAAAFGFGFLMVYTSSTLYHSFQRPRIKGLFRKLDHISIYFLIAGTYTPFVLVYLTDFAGFTLLSVLWTLALVGAIFKLFLTGRFERLSLFIYLTMGWMIVFVAKPVVVTIPADCLGWIAAGGIFYTSGVVFYRWERLTYHHAVWHLFVLGGSLSHYVAVWKTVGG